MTYTHLLEMSTHEPRQYRVTVLEDKDAAIMTHMSKHADSANFRILGYFDTPEELMKVLVPYLQMEDSK